MPKPKKNESKQDFLGRCTQEVMAEGKEQDQAFAVCNAYWDDAKGTRNALTLSAPVELVHDAKDPDKPKGFAITAYTGNVIDLGWWGRLIFDVSGMDTKSKFPVLREHVRDRVVGVAARTWRDDSHLYIGGEFSKSTQDGQEVLKLAEEGFPWQASVGIWPKKVKVLDGEEQVETVNGIEVAGPIEIWQQSLVGEVSFVSLGADDQTAAIVLSDSGVRVHIEKPKPKIKENIMTEIAMDITLDRLSKDAPALLADIRDQAHIAGVSAERKRVADIMAIDASQEAKSNAIEQGLTVDQAYKLFFESEKKRNADALIQMQVQAPQPVGQIAPAQTAQAQADIANLPVEERAKLSWDKDPALRTEFAGDFAVYLACEKAMNAGLVKSVTNK